jgi:phenylacetate-coenzyme A ligase PaaK-like adenylate-forming protein
MSNDTSSIRKTQHSVLLDLLEKAAETEFGRAHDFANISSYKQFAQNISPQGYASIRPAIQKLKTGAENLLWPGSVQQFAVSAGTSGEGKHLPITAERLQSDRRFMRKVVKTYLKQRPNIFKLAGSHLSMPGSVEEHGDLLIGEISGFTALNAPGLLRLLQVVDPRKLTKMDFQQKFDLLLEEAIDSKLKVITAVPSWILTLFQQVLKKTGSSSIAEVWPNLQLLVCGGVKLANYRPHLKQLADGLQLDFIETYGASEGYIGFSDGLEKTDLRMVIDNGVFFECIPNPLPDTDASAIQETVPLWEVKTGVPYALLMTTNAGLWRYTLNDIIEFTALDPLRFEVKGRVNDMLDEFGEALYVYEAEEALQEAAGMHNIEVGNFTISPVLADKSEIPHHRWFVQFPEAMHSDTLKKLAREIDRLLQEINRHYTIRRESDALGAPEVRSITQTEINNWMQRNGKANAQGKLPRILEKNVEKL